VLSSIEIEKKIRALSVMEDIVDAMKAYAGAAIRKTEEIVPNIREYKKNLLSALHDIMVHFPGVTFEKRHDGGRIIVAFGSSQGLCGPYNEKMADAVSVIMTPNDLLFVIGRRLKTAFDLRHVAYGGYHDSVLSINGIQFALRETSEQIMNIYREEDFYTLTCIFTSVVERKTDISVEQILPPGIRDAGSPRAANNPPHLYLNPDQVFVRILEEFLYISFYRCYVESLRSENWYRLRSMEGAAETVNEHTAQLDSLRKYTRQEEITEEMLEILGSGMFYGS
jgi:F-type H+-transporting ATPase subunit gamma